MKIKSYFYLIVASLLMQDLLVSILPKAYECA